MTKQRAKEILTVHAYCSFTSIENNLCMLCPWSNTSDCENTTINREVITKAINILKGIDEMKKIKLSEIRITRGFAETTPNPEKVQKCREYYVKHQEQMKPIVVDHKNILRDGYIQYLILKENNVEEVTIIRKKKCKRETNKGLKKKDVSYKNEETTYVYGMHYNTKEGGYSKEYVWRVPKVWSELGWEEENNLMVGDSVLVSTKYGVKPITVSRIVKSDVCPVEFSVKKIMRKL